VADVFAAATHVARHSHALRSQSMRRKLGSGATTLAGCSQRRYFLFLLSIDFSPHLSYQSNTWPCLVGLLNLLLLLQKPKVNQRTQNPQLLWTKNCLCSSTKLKAALLLFSAAFGVKYFPTGTAHEIESLFSFLP
jgi:hypothetical protein